MVDLTDVQIGSIVWNMVENVPSYISGATLWSMVDNEIYFVEQYTGDTIGVVSVDEKYQPAIISLTASALLKMMELQGADVSNIRLGDFSISKGQGSSTALMADKMREDGLMKLESLGTKINYFKALS